MTATPVTTADPTAILDRSRTDVDEFLAEVRSRLDHHGLEPTPFNVEFVAGRYVAEWEGLPVAGTIAAAFAVTVICQEEGTAPETFGPEWLTAELRARHPGHQIGFGNSGGGVMTFEIVRRDADDLADECPDPSSLLIVGDASGQIGWSSADGESEGEWPIVADISGPWDRTTANEILDAVSDLISTVMTPGR